MEIVLATRNQGKIREIREAFSELDIKLLTLKDFPNLPFIKEEGATIQENAIYKAKKVSELTGKVTLADDSGLEVDVLDGRPGVHSARFAESDEARNAKLLRLLKGVPEPERTAKFRCAVAICRPDGRVQVAEGECRGGIGFEERGGEGFGFDPIFVVPEYNKTFAQLGLSIKSEISHRARALQKIRQILGQIISEQ